MKNPELIRRLADHPQDRATYEVYADWLQSQGDPRGELVMLMLRAEDQPSTKLATDISAYEQRHSAALRGAMPFGISTAWRRGFIDVLRLDRVQLQESLARVLQLVLEHESASLVGTIQLVDWSSSEDVAATLDVIARIAPRSLRAIELGTTSPLLGLAAFDGLPNLERLVIEGGRTGGNAGYASMQGLSWALSAQALRDIAHHKWPLTSLELTIGRGDGGFDDLRPLFRRDDTSLTHLSISAAGPALARPQLASDLVAALVASPMAKQLEYLGIGVDLARADYRTLLDHKHRFKKLKTATLPVDRHAKALVARSTGYYG